MARWNGLQIGGALLILGGLAFLLAAYFNIQQNLYGAGAALLCVGSLLIALGANRKPDAE
jgi:hypothetical protein